MRPLELAGEVLLRGAQKALNEVKAKPLRERLRIRFRLFTGGSFMRFLEFLSYAF